MPNPNRKYTINFNLVLDKETDAFLIRIAGEQCTSKAHVLRSLIRDRHTMQYRREPLCATGRACLCPHAHLYPPSIPAKSSGAVEAPIDA